MRVVYCHGFASSPAGRKAGALRALLEPQGVHVVAPDLNVPTFERLDWRAMVDCVVAAASDEPTRVIVGSSLGALVALEASRRCALPLVLVAPTLGFGPAWTPPLPPGDPVRFTDAATGADRHLHRAFVEEFLRGPPDVEPPPCAVTLIAGRRDTTIAFARVRGVFDRWVASGRLATRSELIDLPGADHGMGGFDDVIADGVRRRAR